jgi:hypothetical protein
MKLQLVWTACYDIVICAPMGDAAALADAVVHRHGRARLA